MDKNDISALAGLVAAEANRLRHDGVAPKEAYAQAVKIAADAAGIPNDESLNRALYEHRSGGRKPAKHRGKRKYVTTASQVVTMTNLYREWLKDHNTVPLDHVLAHFTGIKTAVFSQVRVILAKEGYGFQHGDIVYDVTDPVTNEIARLEERLAELKRAKDQK